MNIFEGHLLPLRHSLPVAAPQDEPAWVALYLFLCLLLLVLVRSAAYPRLVRIVQSTFSNQVMQQLELEEVNLFRSYALALNLLFVLNVAFLFYKYNESRVHLLENSPSLHQYVLVFTAVLTIALYRLAANQVIAFVTGARKTVSEYLVSSSLINQTTGLVLFPLLALGEFSSVLPGLFFWLGVTVLGLSLILRWYRGLMMAGGAGRLGFIEIFSYFCALEILPVLVLVKYVVENY